MKYFFMLAFLAFSVFQISAQEVKATCRIVTPQIQKADPKTFQQLEKAIEDFINNRKWSDDQYEPFERIELNLSFTVTEEITETSFKTDLTVQVTRPIFGSTYKSALLNHLDKDIVFNYEQGQPLDFNIDLISDPLSAVLAFYCYVAIGLDADSFAPLGGDDALKNANLLVQNVPQGWDKMGWKAADGGKNRNRFFLVENLTNPKIKPMRQAMHTFYRKGLDQMGTDVEKGKVFILEALEAVDKANSAYFNCMIVQMFGNAKRDELIEMFKIAAPQQKQRVFQIMSKVDPSNAAKYREMGI